MAVNAQEKPVVIGFLHGASPGGFAPHVAALRVGLSEGGYIEGRNLTIDYHWLEGRYERSKEVATELVRKKVDLIFTGGSPAPVQALKAATTAIPIVFALGRDPVRLGLVDSLSQPGGNLTGLYMFVAALESKRLGLLREMVPEASLIAVLLNPDTANTSGQLNEIHDSARTFGQPIRILHARTELEIDAAFATAIEAGAKAMQIAGDAFLISRRDQIVALAARYSIPTIHEQREAVLAGGLMSYGTDLSDTYRQAGRYSARILKGEKPANLPVVQSSKFELVLNLKTARTLGLDIPPGLSARADEMIE